MLASDPRVIAHEGLDARHLSKTSLPRAPSLVTCDVSFVSLILILPAVLPLAAPGAALVALINPQFEAGPGRTVKGIVKDNAIRRQACDKIESLVKNLGWQIIGIMASPIEGGDGNQEFLLGAIKG
jgi:23S rRNA (cytidine1920-2'-O)/16S rRNA (cytidine1409-2'-O)-methyltransferase